MFLDRLTQSMRNQVRNCQKLFLESNLFGTVPIKSKTTCFAVSLCLTHDLSVNFASLFLEIQDLLTVHVSWLLINLSTLSDRNHSVKFHDLKLSTKNSPCELFGDEQRPIQLSREAVYSQFAQSGPCTVCYSWVSIHFYVFALYSAFS